MTGGSPCSVPPSDGLAPVIAAIGEDAALLLVERFGGQRVFVARDPEPGDLVASVIGLRAAAALGRGRWGGERCKFPLAKRWRVRVLHARGLSNAEIVRRVQMDRPTVQRILTGTRETKQLHLAFE